MIKNVFCAHFALVVADVDYQQAIGIVHKVVIFDIGGDKCLRFMGYGGVYERRARTAAQGYSCYHAAGQGAAARDWRLAH